MKQMGISTSTCPNALERVGAIEAGHLYIEENDRDLIAVIGAAIERLLAAACGPYVKAIVAEMSFQQMSDGGFIIDYEKRLVSGCSGTVFLARPIKQVHWAPADRIAGMVFSKREGLELPACRGRGLKRLPT